MIFLIHSETTAGNIAKNLGEAEYSYYFVLKEFRPLLEEMGLVVAVGDPATEVDRVWRNAARHGEGCMFITFSPPHRSYSPGECPFIPVFAWEFDTLPDESWDDDPRNDWRNVLRDAGRAITHSGFAVATVKAAMGADYPVISLPAPVWDRFAGLYGANEAVIPPTRIGVRGRVFDTREIDLMDYAPATLRQNMPVTLPESAGTRDTPHDLLVEGIVYTSIFSPRDGRKNWLDLICGFCSALQDAADATLVLKLTQRDCTEAIFWMLETLAKSRTFKCRVVMIDGFLSDDSYMELAAASSYTVNTSRGEGQCLPLMEYMSAGKPAIAPRHTAMADYINPGNAFILGSDVEPTIWPHDPREAIRTMRHRIDFETVLAAYRQSYEAAKHDPARYRRMSASAHHDLSAHCSRATIKAKLQKFLLPQPVPAQ